MNTRQAFCTFQVERLHFGVEVHHVQEVLRYQQMTPVPLAPHVIRGLMNLRGQIVTALDLRRRLGLADAPADRHPMNVVVRATDGSVSLLVDSIGDVLELDGDAFEPPPETLRGVPRELIRGAYKLDGHLLLVLEIEPLLNLAA